MKNNKQLLIYELNEAYNIDIYNISLFLYKRYVDKNTFLNITKAFFNLYEDKKYTLCDISDIVNLIQDNLNFDNRFRYNEDITEATFFNLQNNMVAFFNWR